MIPHRDCIVHTYREQTCTRSFEKGLTSAERQKREINEKYVLLPV
jgi:hypothetical protein